MKAGTLRQIFSPFFPKEIDSILGTFEDKETSLRKVRIKDGNQFKEMIIIKFNDLRFQEKKIELEGGDVIWIKKDRIIFLRHVAN